VARVLFAQVVARRLRAGCASSSFLRASGSRVARTSHVDHVCRVASVRDNKLLSLIDTHVNNINSSGRIF
jgi:hypothetical protein